MLVSALCYASMVLVAYWLHSCTSHCMASIHIANLHATPLLVSLPPLQAACTFWGLALLADLHCCVGIVWVGQHCAMLASCLATPNLLVILINVYSSFLATFASQPELCGLALRADLHCSVGIVWVGKHCCHVCWHHGMPTLSLLVCIALAKHCLVANLWCMLLIGHCCANCSCKLAAASLPSLLVACLHDSGDMLHAQFVGCSSVSCGQHKLPAKVECPSVVRPIFVSHLSSLEH